MVDLGAEFLPSKDLALPGPDPSVTLLQEIRAALVALPTLVAAAVHVDFPPPVAPVVHVAEPDLSAIVTAVNGLKPGATAQDIGREIATQLNPGARTSESLMLEAMRELVDKIDFRLQGSGRAFGASGPSNISDNPNRQLGIVTTGPAAPSTIRFAQDASNRVLYLGRATPGASDSDTASTAWTIEAFAYTGANTTPDSIKYASGVAWANRTTVTYQ